MYISARDWPFDHFAANAHWKLSAGRVIPAEDGLGLFYSARGDWVMQYGFPWFGDSREVLGDGLVYHGFSWD